MLASLYTIKNTGRNCYKHFSIQELYCVGTHCYYRKEEERKGILYLYFIDNVFLKKDLNCVVEQDEQLEGCITKPN